MKIKTYGSRFYGGQIDRIEEGLKQLGHEITDNLSEAEILYSNDFEESHLALAHRHTTDGKIYIQNVLDIPYHCWSKHDFSVKQTLLCDGADKITTISETVKYQIKQEFDLDAKVIYQPIKPVTNLNLEKENHFLLVGRLLDPNKNSKIALELIEKFRKEFGNEVRAITVGSEDIGLDHKGIVSDEELNKLYNQSKYVLCFGKIEGLCLPIPEAICGGSIPVCLSHNLTALEFCPHAFISQPVVNEIFVKIQKLDYYYQDLIEGVVNPLAEIYKEQFSPKNVAARIIEAAQN